MSDIENFIKARGITRLCHFTKSRSISYILDDTEGIKSVQLLAEQGHEVSKNDLNRYDGKPNHISCSIEYPNIWYLNKIKDNDKLFKDWVILLIDPYIMSRPETLFCQINAASGHGRYLKTGLNGIQEMFIATNNVGNFPQSRTQHMLDCCPTNGQAEVMIFRNIPKSDIIGMVVKDDKQAALEVSRLRQAQVDFNIDIRIAPDLFKPDWYYSIKQGRRPEEKKYTY